ncbi:MAG: exodeoxyribonuclease VII large subunit [Deferrisomatales bacterium]
MPTPTEAAWVPEPGEILSVAGLVARARGLMEDALGWVWVEGEVTNCRVPASGHAYFTLSDERAQLKAVCFRATLRLAAVAPRDGQRVLARGRLTVYEARGDLQLVVEDLEPAGEGLLRLELETRRRRLAAEGLFAVERKRPLPALPRAVGVVTSATGAALRDVLQVLGRRAPGVHVLLAPARVQGEGAAAELTAALELAASHPEVEVVILGRGGGSLEDLWAFNDEALVRAVAGCRVPVIAAVGHETDVTLVDFAADLRAPTPSAAAELAAGEWARWATEVRRAEAALGRAAGRRLADLRRRLERCDPWARSPGQRLARLRIGLDRAVEALGRRVERALSGRRSRLSALEARLGPVAPAVRLLEVRARARDLETRLAGAAGAAVADRRRRVALGEAGLRALSPLAVLARGYAVVRDSEGRILRDAAAAAPGDRLNIILGRGALGARVVSVRPRAPEE